MRNSKYEGLLCQAIRQKRVVFLYYDGQSYARSYAPYAVYFPITLAEWRRGDMESWPPEFRAKVEERRRSAEAVMKMFSAESI
jgi:hypothetical protein